MDCSLISVIMPIYRINTEYVDQAIKSILQQSYANFELLIINDNPDQNFQLLLYSYHDLDPRIKVYNLDHFGLVSSLNFGIQQSRGKFLARMDSDDIAHPDRLMNQVKFLETYPDVVVVGSWIHLINEKGQIITHIRLPVTPLALKFHFYFLNCIAHPTVMYQKEAILKIGGYSENYQYCEDLDLWIRMLRENFRLTNLPDYLLKYRVHKTSISEKHQKIQQQNEARLLQQFIKNDLDVDSNINDIEIIIQSQQLKNFMKTSVNTENLKEIKLLLSSIYQKFNSLNQLNREEKREINGIYSMILFNLSLFSLKGSPRFFFLLFFKAINMNYLLPLYVVREYGDKFVEFLRTRYNVICEKNPSKS